MRQELQGRTEIGGMAEAEFPLTMEAVWKTREGGPPAETEKGVGKARDRRNRAVISQIKHKPSI